MNNYRPRKGSRRVLWLPFRAGFTAFLLVSLLLGSLGARVAPVAAAASSSLPAPSGGPTLPAPGSLAGLSGPGGPALPPGGGLKAARAQDSAPEALPEANPRVAADGSDANWSALGTGLNGAVEAAAVDGSGNLYVGGLFTTAGGNAANRVAKWDGSSWSALGAGTNGEVRVLGFDGSGNLYAGGSFTTAGGNATSNIAKWDPTANGGAGAWSALGTGVNAIVYAIGFDTGGSLYAGGQLTTAGGNAASYIAKWNGATWSALGSGTNSHVYTIVSDGSGGIYVGGAFTSAGGVPNTPYVAKWNGSWSAVGTGITNGSSVDRLLYAGGNLYTGGTFTQAGGNAASNVAVWNGTAWSALGTGVNGKVRNIAWDGGSKFYFGGEFTTAGGQSAIRAAVWDGSNWSALGSSGLDARVWEVKYNGSNAFYFAGEFTNAGGASALRAAKWTPSVSTTTSLASSSNPSTYGQTVTLTATVTSTGGTPTGNVTFKDGATTLGTSSLSSGVATYSASSLSAGSHSFTAEYGGAGIFLASTSSALSQTVNQASTTTSLASSSNPSAFGQTLIFTATVSSSGGTPTGSVTFKDGTTSLGTGALSAGVATLSTALLSDGSHSITAQYGGDANFNGSTSSTLAQSIVAASSSTSLASSPNPSTFGQTVVFTATVTSSAGTPAGTVTFKDGTTSLGSVSLSGGTASLSTSSLAAGSRSVTAEYGGSSSYASSTSSALAQTVNKASPTVTLASSSATFGQSVAFTATVSSSAGTPTGVVTFLDGSTNLGTGTLSGGTASLSTSSLAAGSHSITAQYGGDNSFGSATSAALALAVGKTTPTVTVTSWPNPSSPGTTVAFTATVSSSAGTPTGSVTFLDGSTTLGTGTLSAGSATYSTSSLSAGTHSITAQYGGDSSFNSAVSGVLYEAITGPVTSGWSALGSGIDGEVSALAVDANGNVYAAKSYAPTKLGKIVTQNNVAQSEVAGILCKIGLAGCVLYRPTLPTATTTTATTTVKKSHVYGWRGGAWTPLGGEFNGTVKALAVDSQGGLYAGGNFSQVGAVKTGPIARWDGTSWSAVVKGYDGSPASGSVSALAADGRRNLYAAGDVYAKDTPFSTMRFTVSRWDGSSLSNLGGYQRAFAALNALAVDGQGNLYTTGYDMAYINGVYAWNGSTWSALSGFGVSSTALAVDRSGNLYAGGNFDLGGGMKNIAWWDGKSWKALGSGTDYPVKALAVDRSGNLYAGGMFSMAGGVGNTINIAKWDGSAWSALGSGMNGSVNVLAVDGSGSLYAGGAFTKAGGVDASHVAVWRQAPGTSTTLSGTLSPSVYGQPVTLTATVTSGGASPSGVVIFQEGSTVLGTATLAQGVGSLSLSNLWVGSHTITAQYASDGGYQGSVSAPLTQTVTAAPGAVALQASLRATFGPDPPQAGITTTYELALKAVNPGAQALTSVVVTDTLTWLFTVNGTSAAVGTIGVSGLNITWNAGTLAAGATTSAVVNAAVTPGSDLNGYNIPVDAGARASGTSSGGSTVSATAAALTTGVVYSPKGAISGRVVSTVGEALSTVFVNVLNQDGNSVASTNTMIEGLYSVDRLPVGVYTVRFTLGAYRPGVGQVVVHGGDTARLDMALTPPAGSVSGTVTDSATGAGIPLATVDLKDSSGATLATTATDSKGGFSVGNVPSGSTLSAAASHPDYDAVAASSSQIRWWYGRAVAAALKLAPRPGPLSGFVTASASGLALAGAKVTVRDSKANVVATAQSGSGGAYSVPPLAEGSYTLYFTHDPSYLPAQAAAAISPNRPADVDGALAPRTGSIFGTVVDCTSSAGSSSVSSTSSATSTGLAGATVALVDSTGRTWNVLSGDTGQFQFPGVVPGTYTLSAYGPYYKAGSGNPVSATTAPGGSASVQLCLEENPGSVAGSVTDALTGAPLPGAAVQLYDRLNNRAAQTRAASDGSFTFTSVPAGAYSLFFTQPNYHDGTQVFAVEAGTPATMNGLLSPLAGSIAGVVKGSANLVPLAGADVSLLDSTGAAVATAMSDNTGHYVLSSVTPGQYTVTGSQPGYVAGEKGSASVSLAPNGTAQGNIYLDPGPSTVSGRAASATTGQPVASARAMAYDRSSNLIATTTTDASGVYTLTNLIEGAYTLTMDGSASGYLLATASVDVGPGRSQTQDVALTPRAGSLSGKVIDALSGSPLGGTDVVLSYADGAVAAAQTSGSGEYVFAQVTAQVAITATASASPPFYEQIAGSAGTGSVPAGGASTINLRLQPSPGSISGQATGSLGPVSGGTIQVSDARGNVVAQATTGDSGSFSLAAVAPGTYTLTFGKAGYLTSSYSATVSPGAVTHLVMAVTPLAGSISGVVKVSSTLRAVAGATVNLEDSSGAIQATTLSDATGHYGFSDVTTGAHQVAALHPDYQSGAGASASGALATNGSLELNLLLAPRAATITGRASNATTGQPIAGATIRVYKASQDLLATATTDASGAYSVSDVQEAADPFTLEWSAPGFLPASSRALAASGQRAVQNMGLVPVDGSLSGRVTDFITGKPVAGATVEVRGSSGDLLATGRTDGAGRYLFVGLSPQATLNVTVTATNYRAIGASSATLNFTSPSSVATAGRRVSALSATADLQVEASPGSISGKATDAQSGAPLPGATVQLYDANNNLVASATADATGAYTFPDVTVGSYTVSVARSGYLPQTQSLAIDAGQASSQDLPLPAQADSVSGAVSDATTGAALVGAMVVLTDTSGLAASTSTRSGGFFAFAGVTSGTSRLSTSHPDYYQGSGSAANLIILAGQPGTANLSLYPRAGNLSGAILDTAGQPVAGATVQVQDGSGKVLGTYTAGLPGTYVFLNLNPGQYTLSASKSGFLDGSSTARITPNQSLSVDIPLMPVAQSIAGSVSDSATGQGITGASVSLVDASGNIYISQSGATGRYSFGSLAPGANTVRASHPDYNAGSGSNASVAVTSGGSASQDLRLDPKKGAIEVAVVDNTTGQAIAGATVVISTTQGVIATLTTDPQGRATVEGLTRGSYTVTASASGRASRTATASVEPNRKAAATLRLGYTIRVTVMETATGQALPGVIVSLAKEGAEAGAGVTSAAGVLLLDVTVTGVYTVTASGVGFDQVGQSIGSVSVYPSTPSPSATLYLTRQRAPHLTLSKSRFQPRLLPFGINQLSAGEPIYYSLSYANSGTAPASGVVITETLPLSTTFLGPAGWTGVDSRTFVYNVGDLAMGAASGVQFVVARDAGLSPAAIITNTAVIGDDGRNGMDLRPAGVAMDVLTVHRVFLPLVLKFAAVGW